MLDMFSLKILGLLVCRDNLNVKEQFFTDLIMGKELYIESDSVRLKRGVKKLIYFAEIMPKIYYSKLGLDDLVDKRIIWEKNRKLDLTGMFQKEKEEEKREGSMKNVNKVNA